MRHGKKINSLSRTAAHRKSMFANMASSLIEHKRINTTTAKAKALRKFVEPLITKSKTDTTHNRRLVFAKLRNKHAVSELFREIAPKVGERPGGYTRIIKLGNRHGDNAEMAMIELVDYNEEYDLSKGKKKKKTRRSRRGKGSGSKNKSKQQDASAENKSDKSEKTAQVDQDQEAKAAESKNAAVEEKETEAPKKAEPKAEEQQENKADATAEKEEAKDDNSEETSKDNDADEKA